MDVIYRYDPFAPITARQIPDAKAALAASGATGVMVGRGAYGAPWLPGRIAAFFNTSIDCGAPSREEQAGIAAEHIEGMLSHYGRALGVKNARKHIGWYLESSGAAAVTVKAWRRHLCTLDDADAVLAGLAAFYRGDERAVA